MKLLGPDNQPLTLDAIPSACGLLWNATNMALARATQATFTDAVNWADLHCFQAEHWENQDGQAGWRVWIEEAAPEADKLKEFVRDDLAEHGWPGVEVVTEW